jgi:hypothetical protein
MIAQEAVQISEDDNVVRVVGDKQIVTKIINNIASHSFFSHPDRFPDDPFNTYEEERQARCYREQCDNMAQVLFELTEHFWMIGLTVVDGYFENTCQNIEFVADLDAFDVASGGIDFKVVLEQCLKKHGFPNPVMEKYGGFMGEARFFLPYSKHHWFSLTLLHSRVDKKPSMLRLHKHIKQLPIDYEQCGVYKNELYMTNFCRRAWETRRITYFFSYHYRRAMEAVQHGFVCPLVFSTQHQHLHCKNISIDTKCFGMQTSNQRIHIQPFPWFYTKMMLKNFSDLSHQTSDDMPCEVDKACYWYETLATMRNFYSIECKEFLEIAQCCHTANEFLVKVSYEKCHKQFRRHPYYVNNNDFSCVQFTILRLWKPESKILPLYPKSKKLSLMFEKNAIVDVANVLYELAEDKNDVFQAHHPFCVLTRIVLRTLNLVEKNLQYI